jgi:hypothetical protein
VTRTARLELCRQVFKLRRNEVPVVEHRLQATGDTRRVMRHAQVAGDDDELPVAGAIAVGRKFQGTAFPDK